MDAATQQFNSQMEFLKAYSVSFEQKKEAANTLQGRLKELQPLVEESEKISEELNDLNKSMRLDEKFLVSMNEMVLRNTGKPISEGPLFDASQETNGAKQEGEL